MDLRPTDEQRLLRQIVREFAEAEMAPHTLAWDEASQFQLALLPKLAGLGLMGIQVPEHYGGAAMGAVEYCICIEELARVDPEIALTVAAHNGLAAAHIYRFGSDAQRARYLTPLAEGRHLGGWALTEPQAGSTRTAATQVAGGGRLNGTKTFTTQGTLAGALVVMAVTDPAQGHHGISAFVLERSTPGLAAGRKDNKLGMRASDTAELLFTDCVVPDDQRLGDLGKGFIGALNVLDAGRIAIAALAVGLAQGAYEAARRHAVVREQFGQPTAGFQAIPFKIADMATEIEAARWLTYRAAYLKDRGRPTTRESAIATLFSSEAAVRVAEQGVQMHGEYGFVKNYHAEKFFRDVKLTTIGEGTSEIQRLVVAREYPDRPHDG
jgi:alkylation response protein AidB-like acyl-CoA dehydrogenase